MDVHDKLADLMDLIEQARAMPMSASALVNRHEVLAMLDELRELLPEDLHNADVLLADREAVLAQGQAEADALIAAAHQEHERLVSETVVMASAQTQAQELTEQTETAAARLMAEADDYVDRKLGEFEVVLEKLSQQVYRGRTHLAERGVANGSLGFDPAAAIRPKPARGAHATIDLRNQAASEGRSTGTAYDQDA